MDSNKLRKNLEKLKNIIPIKPDTFTKNYPKNIRESLNKYLRQRTISIMRSACWIYDLSNWPLPLYIDPDNIKIGYLNEFMFTKLGMNDFRYFDLFGSLQHNKYEPYELKHGILTKTMWLLRYRQRKRLEYYDWLIVPILCKFFRITNIDDFNIELFETNIEYVKSKILNNVLLAEKQTVIKEIFNNYNHENYASCICTLYPIIDFITRNYFGSSKFSKDITSVNAMFKAAGFDLNDIDNLKPGAATAKFHRMVFEKKVTNKQWIEISDKNEYGLGFPGIALSSFLHFSYKYYEYYRTETVNNNYLNRHAILHGASNFYGTKVNAVKLFSYLYLMLELESVLKIVFSER